MPPPIRDSSEEIDVKSGRKSRAVADAASGVDSPLRRSTRKKTSAKSQYGSSSESPLSDTSNVSSTQTKRVTRRRTIAMDSIASTETMKPRTLRSRINSISSDASEIIEIEVGTPTKKTRSSSISVNDAGVRTSSRRSKRLVRAGSEASSPPPPIRITRNTRATSVGPDSNSGSKAADKYSSELLSTPLRMRRRTLALPTEATVLEEKSECVKVAVVQLNRQLPDVMEHKGTESNESLSTLDTYNTTPKSRSERNPEDENSVTPSQNNSPEKNHSVDLEEREVHASINDEEMSENNKKTSEDDKKLPVHVKKTIELPEDNECQILSQNEDADMSKKLDLKHQDLLNKSIDRGEDKSNKENVAANVNDTETLHDVMQSLKPMIATSPNSERSLASKRHSKELLKITYNETSMQEVISIKDVDNNLSTDVMVISDNDEENSNNMEKLVVSMEAESTGEIPSSQMSDKIISLENCTKLTSDDSIEFVDCTNIEVDDDSCTQMSTLIDKKPENIHDKTDNEDDDQKSDISIVEKNVDKNVETERYNICTEDKCDMIGENTEPYKTEDEVNKHDEMSGIETSSSANLSNSELPKSSEATLVTDSQQSVLDCTCNLQPGDVIKNTHSNSRSISESSDAHVCVKDSADSKTNQQDSVTDVIKSGPSSIVTDAFGEAIEDARELEEQAEKVSALDNSLTLNKQPVDEMGSTEKDLNISQETSKDNEKHMEINDNDDSDSNVEDLFQDIPASEWKEKNASAADENSVHSVSTERLENESEGEADLVLVDKEAWLAAEKMKIEREKEAFDFDSDDTVLLKTKRDSLVMQKENNVESCAMENEHVPNQSKNRVSLSKERKSLQLKQRKHEEDEMVEMEDTQDTENTENVDRDDYVAHKSKTRATPKRNSSMDKSLNESHEETEKTGNVSLNKSKLSEDVTKKRKSLNKSMQESNKLDEHNKTQEMKKEKSLTKSNVEEIEKSETKSFNESNTLSSSKMNDKNQSLNSSLKKKMKPQRLSIVSTDESDNDLNENNQKWKGSSTKRKLNKIYSTSVNRGSDSNESENISESDDSQNKTVNLPKFLFGGSTDSNSEDNDGPDKNIDSDIEAEYNLQGKNISKFSDDDVPGDECRASETESSDPDDNGSDLADFVVDDDEVEDEEDDGSEDEDGKDIENENHEEDSEENTEDKKTDVEMQDEDEGMEVKDEEQADETTEEEKDSEGNKENIVEKSMSKTSDTSIKQKYKSRKSGDLNSSETIRSDKKKKKQQKDTSQNLSDEAETSLANISLSIFESKKAKRKRSSGEVPVENVEQSLNESEFVFNKKLQKLNKSMECSTPKVSSSKREKFNVSAQMLHTSLDGIRKKQGTKSSEVKEEDMISDEEENKNMTLNEQNISKKLSKMKANETLAHRSLPSELIEVVTQTNLSRPMSSRVVELNKTSFIPESESPTTKYLKKEKLNESAPVLKLHGKIKKLDDTGVNNEQRDELEDQNEDLNEQNTEASKVINASVKAKILKLADSLLEKDQKKKPKIRKQSVVDIHDYVKSESLKIDFHDIYHSTMAEQSQNIVPNMSTDNKVETVAVDKTKKRKKKKENAATVAMVESRGEVAETESTTNDNNECNVEKKKKKKKKEKVVAATLDAANVNEELKIVKKKKKKKVLDTFSNEKVLDEEPPKKKLKKQQLIQKEIVSKDKGTSCEKTAKKRKQLSSEDTNMQHENVSGKEVSKKKKKLSKDVLHNENISVQTLRTKKQKVHEDNKKENVKCNLPNKLRESRNAPSEENRQLKVRSLSKTPEEATTVLKQNNDRVKVKKQLKMKKRLYLTSETPEENKIKIKKPEAKIEMAKANKTEVQEKRIKRLPDEVLENISDIPMKPLKRRKVSKVDDQLPSSDRTLNLKSKEIRNIYIEDDFTSPSTVGSTTEFNVINLSKIKKIQKHSQMHTTKQKVLGKKKREPVSAYLMYLEKQKASGKDKFGNRHY